MLILNLFKYYLALGTIVYLGIKKLKNIPNLLLIKLAN
jgi:hypothetical protein